MLLHLDPASKLRRPTTLADLLPLHHKGLGMASTSTPSSVIASLARITSEEAAAALEASGVSQEVLAAIEAAAEAAAEAANKRRMLALDVKNDALGRVGTIRTLTKLLGRHMASLVCRRWREDCSSSARFHATTT